MSTVVTMPKLGLTMTQGMVAKWLVQEGQAVEEGQALAIVMSAKITQEIEAPASGTIRLLAQADETCPVGQAIGVILKAGESLPEAMGSALPAAPPFTPAPDGGPSLAVEQDSTGRGVSAPTLQAAPARGSGRDDRAPTSSPAARRLAHELGVDIARVPGTGRGGRITESDVQAFHDAPPTDGVCPPGAPAVQATPLARRMAEEEGLDLAQIEGTGHEGRITEDDVLRVLEGKASTQAPQAGHLRTLPLTGMRQIIAERMLNSLQTTAQLSLTARADVSAVVQLRDVLRQRWNTPISYTDLLVKGTAAALREHPLLNSTLQMKEPAGRQIVLLDDIHIGVAVALEEGLIVPVLRHADKKSLLEVHRALRDLTTRARSGTLAMDEVTGGTFTLTNLGMYGVETFTPILNPPEAAILGVGCIREELTLVQGQTASRSVMSLSLTIDHRIVDGAPGAAFLQTLVQFLEHPALIFAGTDTPGRKA